MSTLVLLTVTGLGLGALYFLVASGLSLVFGLADVLNFAHGLFLSVGAYAAWWATGRSGGTTVSGLAVALAFGAAAGTAAAVAVERIMIRPLYGRPAHQILATVGLSLAGVAAVQAAWGTDARSFRQPASTRNVWHIAAAAVPANRLVLIACAGIVLAALAALLRYSRFGLVVRAGVHDREMVTALGIDVRTSFTLVFALAGAAAGLAGGLGGIYFGAVSPDQGSALLIFAIIVVVVGGLGSITGTAVAAAAIGLFQQYVNYYALGLGDVCVIAVLAAVLLARRERVAGRVLA